MKFLIRLIEIFRRIIIRLAEWFYRPLFGRHGKRFRFDPYGIYSYENIFVGDDVYRSFPCFYGVSVPHHYRQQDLCSDRK